MDTSNKKPSYSSLQLTSNTIHCVDIWLSATSIDMNYLLKLTSKQRLAIALLAYLAVLVLSVSI